MKRFLLLFFILVLYRGYGQNLIPNPGFESNVEGKVSDWLQPLNEYYHYETHSRHEDGKITFRSYNGLCLIHPGASEYLVVKLKAPLIKNARYCASLSAVLATRNPNAVVRLQSIEWKFMDAQPSVSGRVKIYAEPDIIFDLNANEPLRGVKHLSQTYKARGDEVYLVIGKFFNHETESVSDEILTQKEVLEQRRENAITLVRDTFFRHYPPMPDFNGKRVSKKEMAKFDQLVMEIENEKQLIIESILNDYAAKIDSLENPDLSTHYLVRTYFDNVCLSPINQAGQCTCNDTVPETTLSAGNTYRLNNVNFETGKYFLDSLSKAELDNLYELLTQNPLMKIRISGHTDSVNTAEANLRLSTERAKACVNYLTGRGISPERLSWQGFGASKPLTTNRTEEGRRVNRRVEFMIL